MARPERKNADYFPFYAKDGRTLFILEGKYRCKGTGFFTNVMRFLTLQDSHHFCIADETDQMYFFSKCHIDDVDGIIMLEIMVKTGKLDMDLWDEYKIIACQDLLDSLGDAYRKRTNNIITMDEIRVNAGVLGVSTAGNSVKGGDNPQSKVKYTKVKETKINIEPCPHQKIVEIYHQKLPMLSIVQNLSDELKKRLRARWRDDPERQNLEWWEWYFENVCKSDFLTGKTTDWAAGFYWLTGPKNMTKVLNGEYLNRKKLSQTDQAIEDFIENEK